MPQLLPYYLVNQVSYGMLILAFMLLLISCYLLPNYPLVYVTRIMKSEVTKNLFEIKREKRKRSPLEMENVQEYDGVHITLETDIIAGKVIKKKLVKQQDTSLSELMITAKHFEVRESQEPYLIQGLALTLCLGCKRQEALSSWDNTCMIVMDLKDMSYLLVRFTDGKKKSGTLRLLDSLESLFEYIHSINISSLVHVNNINRYQYTSKD